MDFYQIVESEAGTARKPVLEVYPDFKVVRSKDIMVRAKNFYAVYDQETGLWSTDEYDVQRLVDEDIRKYEVKTEGLFEIHRKYLKNFKSGTWLQFRNWLAHISDNSHQLDQKLTFANTDVKKQDYVSRRLNYALEAGDYSAWDEMMNVLYTPEERAKIEWAIGAVVAGDSKTIQKFLVFYGSAGTGKSTVLNVIEKLFQGYVVGFDAKALTGTNNSFATEVFKSNPLVAIQHDGDLSKIVDNTKFNSIVSHETMTINEKFKPAYDMRINAFMFMGTNSPVKITDAKSGIIRRLIDVQPTGNKLPPKKYQALNSQIDFQLGAIAHHSLEVYREMGKDYYEGYTPIEMMLQTDVYFNFVEENIDLFIKQDGVTLKQGYDLYKKYCDEAGIQKDHQIPQYKFREELKNYFHNFEERALIGDVRVRSWYSGFKIEKFKVQEQVEEPMRLVLDEVDSLFDEKFADCPAQYANSNGTPIQKWEDVTTTLKDIDTRELHYVLVPLQEIVIDFDLTDENGEKSLERNLEEASKWPPTYTEYSKSGHGVHLHYYYDGDPEELSRVYSDGIEVKVFTGNSSLRRRLTKCNNIPIATLKPGSLPAKEKKVMNTKTIETERHLRNSIKKALQKEVHQNTKSNIDFIHHVLEEAYMSGVQYDVTDMRNAIFAFANSSTNQSRLCLQIAMKMRFHSEPAEPSITAEAADDRLAFFDVEVFPNLFIISWKFEDKIDSFGQKIKSNVVRMVNPTAQQVEELMTLKLVGYNVRRYDNHILYGAYQGFNNAQLYALSQKLIGKVPGAGFGEAYNISYVDIFDYMSEKKTLKEWQIYYGFRHKELGLPWDQPVPEELWDKVGEYCDNDVITTEELHNKRRADFVARLILADLSGLPVNSTTQNHTARIVFGTDRAPQTKFKYSNLADEFPGYTFDHGKSTYKGEVVGEGGLVRAKPGMYSNVALLDVESMHPTTIIQLELFGDYTKNYAAIKAARMAIKRKDYDEARKMFDGKLAKYLTTDEEAEALSYALKIVINIVYGLTAASFDNAFRDPRNIDNIVAKRGALFMMELREYIESLGGQVIHIKTDSVKIPDATPELIEAIMEFGDRYGYTFDHEKTFEKLCLVNDAVYIGKTLPGRKPAHWEAVGAQFQHPFVYKTMFTHEPVEFWDYAETKTVQTALYLDKNNTVETTKLKDVDLKKKDLTFVGKAGQFVPLEAPHGGTLLREGATDENGKIKWAAAGGTTGFRWLEADVALENGLEPAIDMRYYRKLVDAAHDQLNKFGDAEWFLE